MMMVAPYASLMAALSRWSVHLRLTAVLAPLSSVLWCWCCFGFGGGQRLQPARDPQLVEVFARSHFPSAGAGRPAAAGCQTAWRPVRHFSLCHLLCAQGMDQ